MLILYFTFPNWDSCVEISQNRGEEGVALKMLAFLFDITVGRFFLFHLVLALNRNISVTHSRCGASSSTLKLNLDCHQQTVGTVIPWIIHWHYMY